MPTESESSTYSYDTWIRRWTFYLSGILNNILVPPEARALTTALNVVQWQRYLLGHPNGSLVHFFIIDISQGFRLGFDRLPYVFIIAYKNLSSALQWWTNT